MAAAGMNTGTFDAEDSMVNQMVARSQSAASRLLGHPGWQYEIASSKRATAASRNYAIWLPLKSTLQW